MKDDCSVCIDIHKDVVDEQFDKIKDITLKFKDGKKVVLNKGLNIDKWIDKGLLEEKHRNVYVCECENMFICRV